MSFKIFLYIYYENNNNYTQDLKYLNIVGYKA